MTNHYTKTVNDVSVDADIFDDLFHNCAWRAYLEIAQETGRWPPDCELTKRRANQHYEAENKLRFSKKS